MLSETEVDITVETNSMMTYVGPSLDDISKSRTMMAPCYRVMLYTNPLVYLLTIELPTWHANIRPRWTSFIPKLK